MTISDDVIAQINKLKLQEQDLRRTSTCSVDTAHLTTTDSV